MERSAASRLTRLELHGFKSFANRTVFVFEDGITAIIGPNGSGKSNISDGVRWALGEQSHSSIRSKKTEDVIFAGGQGKAPSGMAEVTVTFDNGTGWLPIAFTEVTVTRRAFRDGENHYLINGRRVRLKDVSQLTASLGQSHTVVGQGLVDAALSQRAEERRGLFEHAADLTGLRLKAADAAKNLAEAEANSARTRDLLTELGPRLKTLERAARQAREWQGVHERLQQIQRSHYACLLREAQARFDEASTAAGHNEALLADRHAIVARLVAGVSTARVSLDDARHAVAQHAARLQTTTEHARKIDHERDLAQERYAALTRRREDMADTQSGLDEQVAGVERDLMQVAADLESIGEEVDRARSTVAAIQIEAAASRQARTALEREASELAKALSESERKQADLSRRRFLLEQRRETDDRDRARIATQDGERTSRIERLAADLAGFDLAERESAARLVEIEQELARIAAAAEDAGAEVERVRAAAVVAEREAGAAVSRLDALRRIQESGSGLHQGVREVLRAAKGGKLTGIRGTIAELIALPVRYDTAIEVALGGHLQDIVVSGWHAAEAAIVHLKKGGTGRATFQPLDTVRASRSGGAPRALEDHGGFHGIASDLIDAPPELGDLVASLLGRTLVVDDLEVAKTSLPHLPAGWSAVTLAGEIVRTGGSVTGGAATRESGLLGRERDLRELPAEIVRLEAVWEAAVDRITAANQQPRRLTAERQRCEADRAGIAATSKERQSQRARLAGWLADLEREQSDALLHLGAMAKAAERAGADLIALAAESDRAASDLESSQQLHAALIADLARLSALASASDQGLSAESSRLAGLDERLRAERRRESGLRAQREALGQELALRSERAAGLDDEIIAIAAQRDRLAQEATRIERAREEVEAEQPPLAQSAKAMERHCSRTELELDSARTALLEAERSRGAAGLAVERARADVGTVRQRILDELDEEDPERLIAENAQFPDDLSSPAEAEREIARLKERLRRVGYVGENVVEEYDREAERHAFLREQLADVQGAAADLQTLLDDLYETMRSRFEQTFSRVSIAFSEMFTTLFGGGSARLVLVASENGESAGVDIVAQPPGKRLQSLALLSGGERALTAVALLFAILRVNPTPFCLLDEVDAALDEANIVRFREQLRSLAAETQAIVITHNRGTVEVADTLYGVSMRDDGVSQVLSLRLAETAMGA